MNPQNPLIVQSNNTLLLEVDSPLFRDARDAISAFAHLEKSPEHIHTYVITPLSLWNAASLGMNPDEVVTRLRTFSKYDLPENVISDIGELMGRYGAFTLNSEESGLVLWCDDAALLGSLLTHSRLAKLAGPRLDPNRISVSPQYRGLLKQTLIGMGFPVRDLAGYVEGDPYAISLSQSCRDNDVFQIRAYQRLAGESFCGGSADGKFGAPGGSGVVVLPCGAGKTVVGIYVMSLLQVRTLILVTNITAARQWKREIADKTTIPESEIGEYSGECKEIKPVTIATYQILTYRARKEEVFAHFGVFNAENWGLIIYDEVHLLPAPVFQVTADLQARRRLGLTATLIREDGLESDVFSLIGPKKFDVPWKDLEKQGWIATARCVEIRIDLPSTERLRYLALPPKQQVRAAYENPLKIPVVKELLVRHSGDRVLIIGQYLSQLEEFQQEFQVPMITGSTPNGKRDELYDAFRSGEIKTLILSKVGNFAIDLPDANVAIQISGSYGSRQEEAQRLGRILRPKKHSDQAVFYSIVTRESKELDFAMNRQLFLTEQGYTYDIKYWDVEDGYR